MKKQKLLSKAQKGELKLEDRDLLRQAKKDLQKYLSLIDQIEGLSPENFD